VSEDLDIASADDLFGQPAKRRYSVVGPLPVLGKRVRIQSLNELEVSSFQAATITQAGGGLNRDRLIDANRRLISLCLVDKDGNRIIGKTQFPQLAQWDAADTQYLYDECAKHVGIHKGDIEDLAKNSDGTPAVDSHSA